MIRSLAAAVLALPLLATGLPAFAQCAMPAPEPKTSVAPVEPVVQPG